MIENIPNELLSMEHFPEDVTILIGENGSGKSTLLNDLFRHFLNRGKKVIGLAQSIHDKFDGARRNFKILRGRSGRRKTRSIIKQALQTMAIKSDIQRLKNASRALEYVGFNPVIGFRIDQMIATYNDSISNSDLEETDKEALRYLLDKVVRDVDEQGIIWLQMEKFDFIELDRSSLIELFLWESRLKKMKIISRIEVFLRKKRVAISMLNASSGELTLITSIVYLATIITENTVILIDEPENSLHPKWQKEYSRTLVDIFYLFQPKIIIATHSPMIVNGAELFIKDPKIYKAFNFSFELQAKEPLNVEELLFRFFDVTTPQNRFLSEWIVRLLNFLAAKKLRWNLFKMRYGKLKQMLMIQSKLKCFEALLIWHLK